MKFSLALALFFLVYGTVGTVKLSCPEVNLKQKIAKFKVKFCFKLREGTHQFNPRLKTVVLIHNFWQTSTTDWIVQMTKALLHREPMNVLTVDWSSSHAKSDMFNYGKAALATERVAKVLSIFIASMEKQTTTRSVQHPYLHLIGFSLGAHIAGLTGRHLLKTYNISVNRITGLDPAHKCFEDGNVELKLRKDDAQFVDVIHTSFTKRGKETLGSHAPIGTVDFYPNGGSNQPHCRHPKPLRYFKNTMRNAPAIAEPVANVVSKIVQNIFKVNMKDSILKSLKTDYNPLCDNEEATRYFIESLHDEKKFFANPVDSLPIKKTAELQCHNQICTDKTCIKMGINADKYQHARGAYYVDTTSTFAECKSEPLIEVSESGDVGVRHVMRFLAPLSNLSKS